MTELPNVHVRAEILAPEPDRLSDLTAPADRREWWFERLRESWQFL